jgi:DNA-binding transcriptional ArsR family regulator
MFWDSVMPKNRATSFQKSFELLVSEVPVWEDTPQSASIEIDHRLILESSNYIKGGDMDPDRAYERAELLKAFAHPTRLQILAELGKGTRCVTDMEDILPVTQVNISQHLTVLRNAKLVDFAQDGAVRCYYLSRPKLIEGVLTLLSTDHPVIRKTKEQIDREKAKGGKERVAARG